MHVMRQHRESKKEGGIEWQERGVDADWGSDVLGSWLLCLVRLLAVSFHRTCHPGFQLPK